MHLCERRRGATQLLKRERPPTTVHGEAHLRRPFAARSPLSNRRLSLRTNGLCARLQAKMARMMGTRKVDSQCGGRRTTRAYILSAPTQPLRAPLPMTPNRTPATNHMRLRPPSRIQCTCAPVPSPSPASSPSPPSPVSHRMSQASTRTGRCHWYDGSESGNGSSAGTQMA